MPATAPLADESTVQKRTTSKKGQPPPTPSAAEKKYAEEHARTYSTRKGDRLNISAIVLKFNVAPWWFNDHQREGWPSRKWKPLTSFLMPGITAKANATYLETDVANVLAWNPFPAANDPTAVGWVNNYTYRIIRKGMVIEYLTLIGVQLLFPELPDLAAWRWAKRKCRFLTDAEDKPRCINKIDKCPPSWSKTDPIELYMKDDVSSIDKRLKEIASLEQKTLNVGFDKKRPRVLHTEYHFDEDGRWLTFVQAHTIHGLPIGFIAYWSNEDSKREPDRKALRSKMWHDAPGPKPVQVFLEEDIEDIIDGKEHSAHGMGRGVITAKLGDKVKTAAKLTVENLLADGPLSSATVFRKAARINPRFTREVLRKVATSMCIIRTGSKRTIWDLSDKHREEVKARLLKEQQKAAVSWDGESLTVTKPPNLTVIEPEREHRLTRAAANDQPPPAALAASGTGTPAAAVADDAPETEPVIDEGEELAWSAPQGPTHWAGIFQVSYNTMMSYLRTQQIRNKRVSDRRYRILIEDLPEDLPED